MYVLLLCVHYFPEVLILLFEAVTTIFVQSPSPITSADGALSHVPSLGWDPGTTGTAPRPPELWGRRLGTACVPPRAQVPCAVGSDQAARGSLLKNLPLRTLTKSTR